MGRAPCCDKANVKKGPWSPEEDAKLKDFIHKFGTAGNWIALPQKAGLKRCGKSCRLRWLNYLRPNIRHGEFTDEEDRIICTLYASIGSRWSIIAAQLPGRTDNDIKNYWNTKLKKKLFGLIPSNQLASKFSPQFSLGLQTSATQLSQSLSSLSQLYNSFYNTKSDLSTPQNFLYPNSNINLPMLTSQCSYNQSNQEDLVDDLLYTKNCYPVSKETNMLMFGGNNNWSSSDGSLHANIGFQENHQKFMAHCGKNVDDHEDLMSSFLDQKQINGVLENSQLMQYDVLEEVKELITNNDNNGCNVSNNFLFNDF